MDRRVIYSTQDAFKSESKLDYDEFPSTSSRTWLPGEPITVYEERYESSSEVETWIQTQSIGTRLLDKHDRLILKHKGWFTFSRGKNSTDSCSFTFFWRNLNLFVLAFLSHNRHRKVGANPMDQHR